MENSLFIISLLKLYKGYCKNDRDKWIVNTDWTLLKYKYFIVKNGRVRNLYF